MRDADLIKKNPLRFIPKIKKEKGYLSDVLFVNQIDIDVEDKPVVCNKR